MSGPGQIWQQAADTFQQHFDAVSDEQWASSTPCAEWTVTELVEHAVGVQAGIGGALGATIDASQGWEAVRSAVGAAMADESNFEGAMEGGPFAGMPKHQLAGLAVGDLLVHAWDLGKAIGADTTLPAEAVEAVQMGLERMPTDMMRAPGRFGEAVEVADDASAQDKLIAFTGRQP